MNGDARPLTLAALLILLALSIVSLLLSGCVCFCPTYLWGGQPTSCCMAPGTFFIPSEEPHDPADPTYPTADAGVLP